jgi:hypothetical protein
MIWRAKQAEKRIRDFIFEELGCKYAVCAYTFAQNMADSQGIRF